MGAICSWFFDNRVDAFGDCVCLAGFGGGLVKSSGSRVNCFNRVVKLCNHVSKVSGGAVKTSRWVSTLCNGAANLFVAPVKAFA
jgi:hypothetical protein